MIEPAKPNGLSIPVAQYRGTQEEAPNVKLTVVGSKGL